MTRVYALVALGLTLPSLAGADPCTDPVPSGVVNVTSGGTWIATLPDHMTNLYGDPQTPLVVGYELRWYQEGAPAPFQATTIPRAAWALHPGSANCYTTPKPAMPVTPNVRYRATLVALANPAAGVANSAPSAESNPFGSPAAPGAPGVLLVRP